MHLLNLGLKLVDGGARAILFGMLKAVGGWTAGAFCGAANPDVVTVRLNGEADFTIPADGWSFTKTGKGRQTIGDIQFDKPLHALPQTLDSWANNSSSLNTYTLAGQLILAANTAVSITSNQVLVIGKQYKLQIDIDSTTFIGTPVTDPDLDIWLGAILHTSINVLGVYEKTITITDLSHQHIALVANNNSMVINSISFIEVIGDVENASTVDSSQPTPSQTIEFTLGWVNDPTYGDIVEATYDGLGDYLDKPKPGLGNELSPDPDFEGSGLGLPWTSQVGSIQYNTPNPGQITIGTDAVFNAATEEPYEVGETYVYRIDIESSDGSVIFLANQGGVFISSGAGGGGVFTGEWVLTSWLADALGVSTFGEATSTNCVINSFSVHKKIEIPVPMEATSTKLTNCLDVS